MLDGENEWEGVTTDLKLNEWNWINFEQTLMIEIFKICTPSIRDFSCNSIPRETSSAEV